MKALIAKGVAGILGIGGLGVGGFYGIKALNKETKPNTVKEQLILDGFTPFPEEGTNWQAKFDAFRAGNKIATLRSVLQEVKAGFEVDVSKANTKGGEELKKWCSALLKLEKSKLTTNKSVENAKSFCAEQRPN